MPPRCAQLGAAVFSGDRPKDYKFIIEAADRDDNIRTPASANINDDMRALIPLTPEWTFWPDYDRVRAGGGARRAAAGRAAPGRGTAGAACVRSAAGASAAQDVWVAAGSAAGSARRCLGAAACYAAASLGRLHGEPKPRSCRHGRAGGASPKARLKRQRAMPQPAHGSCQARAPRSHWPAAIPCL